MEVFRNRFCLVISPLRHFIPVNITSANQPPNGVIDIATLTYQRLTVGGAAVWMGAFVAMTKNLANGLHSLSKLFRKKRKPFSFRWR